LDKTAPAAWAGTNRTIDTGTLLKLNGSKSTDNIAIEWYTWSFTDIVPSFYIGINFSYTFNNAGTIKVTLNVSDYAGWWNATSIWIQVRDTIPPIANFSSIQTGIQRNYVRFNASKSTDNVQIIRYTWDFGDGNITITDGPLISHSYLNPGRYIVNLTVTDEANNNATTSLTIQIEGKQMPFPWWVLSVVIPEGLIITLGILWLHKRTKFKTSKKSI
jgi:PKD repeat protein